MWVSLNDAFLSIVQHRDKPNTLLVRARVQGDIERVFQGATVAETPEADYRFRAEISRPEVEAAMVRSVRGIDYDNFKDSVESEPRHDAYLSCWSAMRRLQQTICSPW